MNIEKIVKAYLLEKDEANADALLNANVDVVREALSQGAGGDWHFSSKELEIIAGRPSRVARFYDVIFPEKEVHLNDGLSIEKDIEAYEAERRREIISAFEEMVDVLPLRLREWGRWFALVEEDNLYEHSALNAPGTEAMGTHSHELARFGLTPEIIAETFDGFALLFAHLERNKVQGRCEKPCFVLDVPNGRLLVGAPELVQFVSETPGLPEGVSAPSLIDWALEALKVLPFMVPGYEITQHDDGPPHAHRCESMSLSACWTRRAVEPVEEKFEVNH